jgi:hypothetical protein
MGTFTEQRRSDPLPSGTVSITVLSVKAVKFGKIFALASVEIDVDRCSLLSTVCRPLTLTRWIRGLICPSSGTKMATGATR